MRFSKSYSSYVRFSNLVLFFDCQFFKKNTTAAQKKDRASCSKLDNFLKFESQTKRLPIAVNQR